jgi:hypothetical protein
MPPRHHPQDPHGLHAAGPDPQASHAPHAAGPGGRDAELTVILPLITGPDGHFGHRQHINLAFHAARQYGMPAAVETVCGWLRQLTGYTRAPQKYHQTVSRAWVELVAHHVAADPGCANFAVFAARHPALLDKRLLARHYRSSTLAAAEARYDWVEPDLQPFSWTAS